jgi:hypothetical protein
VAYALSHPKSDVEGGEQVEGVLIGWTERIKGMGFPSS